MRINFCSKLLACTLASAACAASAAPPQDPYSLWMECYYTGANISARPEKATAKFEQTVEEHVQTTLRNGDPYLVFEAQMIVWSFEGGLPYLEVMKACSEEYLQPLFGE